MKKNSIPNNLNKFTHLQLIQPIPRLLKQEKNNKKEISGGLYKSINLIIYLSNVRTQLVANRNRTYTPRE
jgi:hypothetical protein